MIKWSESFARKYETPLIEKEYVLKPAILRALGNVRGKKIVDLGCGSGYFSRIFARKGAHVVGVDKSQNQLRIASQIDKTKIRYITRKITNTGLKSKYFDIALLNLVLIEQPSSEIVSKIIKEAYRILKKNGLLIIGEVHPHIVNNKSKISGMYLIGKKTYFNNAAKCKSISLRADGQKMIFYPDYHYTLEFYVNTLAGNGFVITKLLEPKSEENFPTNVVIVAKKI